jgi:hypothetical protein
MGQPRQRQCQTQLPKRERRSARWLVRAAIGASVLVVSVSCGGNSGTSSARPASKRRVTTTTTTTLPTPTTAPRPTSVEWDDPQGFRYQLSVASVMSGPNLGGQNANVGSAHSAPPGKTNVELDIRIKNLLTDRPSGAVDAFFVRAFLPASDFPTDLSGLQPPPTLAADCSGSNGNVFYVALPSGMRLCQAGAATAFLGPSSSTTTDYINAGGTADLLIDLQNMSAGINTCDIWAAAPIDPSRNQAVVLPQPANCNSATPGPAPYGVVH